MRKQVWIVLLLLAMPAGAEQFNFSIPMKLDHLMPTVKFVMVECRVFKAKPPDWMGVTGLVGSWSQVFPVAADSSFNQVVQAKFNPDPAANAADGKYFQCDFRLGVGQYYLWPDPASAQDVTKAKPGAPFLAKQEGALPSP